MPMGVVKKIEKLQRGFLWVDGATKRKIHAVGWAEVCKRKYLGGLGIGSLNDKNKAMLAKWMWRFSKDVNALWRRVICSKYKVDERCLAWDWKGPKSGSFFVKSLQVLLKDGSKSAAVIRQGFIPVVGKGNRLQQWTDF